MSLEACVKEDPECITEEVFINKEASEDDVEVPFEADVADIEAAIVNVEFEEPQVKEELCFDSELSEPAGLDAVVLNCVKQESGWNSMASLAGPCAENIKDELVVEQTCIQQHRNTCPHGLHIQKTALTENLKILRLKVGQKLAHLAPQTKNTRPEPVNVTNHCKNCNKYTLATTQLCLICETERAEELIKGLRRRRAKVKSSHLNEVHGPSDDSNEMKLTEKVNGMRECSVRLERCDAIVQLFKNEAFKLMKKSARNKNLTKFKVTLYKCRKCKRPTFNKHRLCGSCEQREANKLLHDLMAQRSTNSLRFYPYIKINK